MARVAKRLPLLGRLAEARYHWRAATMLRSRCRLRYALFNAIPSAAPVCPRFTLSNGAEVRLRWGSTDVNVFQDVFLKRQYELPRAYTGAIGVVIDAGANIGLTSLYFADRYPRARVIAIEPDHDNYTLLLQNINARDNIIPVNAALWWRHGRLTMHDPGIGAWGLRTRELETDSSNRLPPRIEAIVPVVTVADVIDSQLASGRVSLLKLDIEGAERDVLANSGGWIRNVDVIAAELHEQIHPDVVQVFRLATHGFCVESRGETAFAYRV